ncbi:hypothetical protein OF83DRAFT_590460 [Amylostereum chailletii]|nr:hypothetical protein OF83DRAFT_590460 [Amylostereum chailletii]
MTFTHSTHSSRCRALRRDAVTKFSRIQSIVSTNSGVSFPTTHAPSQSTDRMWPRAEAIAHDRLHKHGLHFRAQKLSFFPILRLVPSRRRASLPSRRSLAPTSLRKPPLSPASSSISLQRHVGSFPVHLSLIYKIPTQSNSLISPGLSCVLRLPFSYRPSSTMNASNDLQAIGLHIWCKHRPPLESVHISPPITQQDGGPHLPFPSNAFHWYPDLDTTSLSLPLSRTR